MSLWQQQERKYSLISLEPYKYAFPSDPTVYHLWPWSLFLSYAAGVDESSYQITEVNGGHRDPENTAQ